MYLPGAYLREVAANVRREVAMMFRIHLTSLGIIAIAASTLAACGSDTASSAADASGTPGVQVYASQKARLTAASVPASEVQAAAAANNAFGFEMYKAVTATSTSGNVLFSPYSAEIALAMTAQGAKGDTLAQMGKTLGFSLPDAKMHPAFGALDLALMSRGQGASGKDGQPFRLKIANSTWGQDGYAFVPAFLDGLKVNYGAALNAVDFITASETARLAINSWVLAATEQKIKDLIPKGGVDAQTRLVLVNAIYFNAAWSKQFDAKLTLTGTFHAPVKDVTVPLMHQTAEHPYNSGSDWEAVDLRYDGGQMAMLLVLPKPGKLAAVEASLDTKQLDSIVAKLATTNVNLTMPRWKIDWASSLESSLGSLGMSDAFDPSKADFSGIGGTKGELYISGVLQKTFAAVDEKGTEAAAATAVIVGTTSAPPPPIEVALDRPFLYFIRDVSTGTVLFIGRVADPSLAN